MLNRRRHCFTLIEVVIALFIFMAFIFSFVSLFALNSKSAVINQHRYQAANLSRQGAEIVNQIKNTTKIKYVDWNDGCFGLASGGNLQLAYELGAAPCGFYRWHLKSGSQTITQDNVDFTRSIDIQDITILSTNDAKKVTVTVTWEDYGQTKESKVITLLSNWK